MDICTQKTSPDILNRKIPIGPVAVPMEPIATTEAITITI
jgi:hypothetical protein